MLEQMLDTYGDSTVLALAGAVIGVLFGATAQQSRFCLRAATVELYERKPGDRMAIWLLVFFSAMAVTQLASVTGFLDTSLARQIATRGSLSGAIIGGLMFGAGMILARGCASRLLVLSGTGNMRALVTGLVVTLVAQASFRGVLAPLRENISAVWTIEGGPARDLAQVLGLSPATPLILAGVGLTLAIALSLRARVTWGRRLSALAVGLAVALGWVATYAIATTSFEVVAVSSVTFTGPSTDTLMALVTEPNIQMSFGIGLVPGVFLGSALTAALRREWKVERFGPDTPMERYLIGAVLMGFGAMLAGGCAVGAGVSGGAILSMTAWVAAISMWLGSFLMQALLAIASRKRTQASLV